MQLARWTTIAIGICAIVSFSVVAQDRGRGDSRGGFPGGGFPGGGFPGGGFPGGPGGGFPGGGSPGGGGFSSRGGFDPTEMLRRMDANGNGVLEQNELSGRGGDFVRRIAERAGVNPDQPMPIDRLARGMDFGRREEGDRSRDDRDRDRNNDRERDRNQSSSSQAAAPPTGPQGFGSTAAATTGVPGFDTPLMVGASTEPIEKRYDARVLEYVRERYLEDRDANKNGLLERNEWTGRWSTPPDQIDTNRDGVLTMEEMCVVVARRFGSDSSRSPDSRSGDSRGGDSRGSDSRGGDSRFGGGFPGGGPPGGGFGPPGGGFDRGRGFGDRGFGDRGGGDDPAARIRGYAEGFLRQYDENRDGRIDRDEMQRMRPEHQAADTNGDGIITSEELTAHLQKTVGERFAGRGGPPGSGDKKPAETKKSYRVSTPIERLPEGMPDWFLRNDLDADGQISMVEYASSWTDQIASEFTRLDVNSDGIITPDEAKR
jgi:hypothetical protein